MVISSLGFSLPKRITYSRPSYHGILSQANDRGAISTGQRNTPIKFLCRRIERQCFGAVLLRSGFYRCVGTAAPFGPGTVIDGDIVFAGQVHSKCEHAGCNARSAGRDDGAGAVDTGFGKACR